MVFGKSRRRRVGASHSSTVSIQRSRDESSRKALGSKGAQVFQNVEDPADVFILMEWDSVENAKKFGMSGDLKKTMEEAGVVSAPHIHMVKEVQKSKA